MSTSDGKSYHHGDLRRALITQARALLAEVGPSAVTLRQVASLAGVSAAAPYRHFADKESLLAAVTEQGFDELTAAVEQAGGTGLEGMHRIGFAYVDFVAEHQALYRLMFGSQIPDHGKHPGLAAAEERLRAALGASIRQARGAGIIADLDLEDIFATMASVMHGLAMLIGDGQLPVADASAYTARVIKVIDHGLLPRD